MIRPYPFILNLFILLAISLILTISIARITASGSQQLTLTVKQRGQSDILLLDVDYGLRANLTRSDGDDTFPAWSPDGEQLAFYSRRDERTDLYRMTIDGSGFERLAASGGAETPAVWSPDGTWIAYAVLHFPNGGLFIVRPDGTDSRQLAHFQAASLVWSPDSRYIAFVGNCDGNCDIYVAEIDSGQVRQLTHNGLVDAYPTWSPDSQQIAFISNRSQSFDVHIMDLACDETAEGGCVARQLTFNRDIDSFPAWSPDGERIAFSSNRTGNYELYRMAADCGGQVDCEGQIEQLTAGEGRDINPFWSADSQRIAYWSGYANGRVDLYVVDTVSRINRLVYYKAASGSTAVWRPVQ
ncbi:MAG: hypothetical protein LCI00_15240 [Chloroflexi bacterium]|nr:hypothetical protein [Chloroflexota bacterium]